MLQKRVNEAAERARNEDPAYVQTLLLSLLAGSIDNLCKVTGIGKKEKKDDIFKRIEVRHRDDIS